MMMSIVRRDTGKSWARLFALAFLLPCALWAQGTTATVSGFVTDSSGAKVPDATITFTNTATGLVQTTKSNNEGA